MMIIVVMIVSGAVFGGGSAVLAANKNRSAFGWFVLGFIFSFVALIVIAGLSPVPEVRQVSKAKRSSPSTNAKRISQSDGLDWKNGSDFTSEPQDPERPWLG